MTSENLAYIIRGKGIKIPKTLNHSSMSLDDATGKIMTNSFVPDEWGPPLSADAWFDDDDTLKVIHCDYEEDRGATVAFKKGSRKVTLGRALNTLASTPA